MNEEESEDKGFKVKDKRRFDSSGNRKNGELSQESSTAKASTAKESSPIEGEDFVMNEGEGSSSPPGMDFSSFILSLATQALVQLGEMPPPPGVQIEKNVEGAKQMIDMISMLSEKTKGNLSEAEEKLVSEMLHNLRLSYVKHQS